MIKKFLSNNALKIIACISMFFDHLGKILLLFYPEVEAINITSYVFSIIGRLSLPIFLFLIVEGYHNTKNIKKYFLRLGTMALVIGAFLMTFSLIPSMHLSSILYKVGNIFIDLILFLLVLYLLDHKKMYIKCLAILPLAYFTLCIFIQSDMIPLSNITKSIFSGILSQYSLVTPLILISYLIVNYIYKSLAYKNVDESNIELIDIKKVNLELRTRSYAIALATVSLIMYLLTYSTVNLNTDFAINTYFILSALFIIEYNGKLGKSNKIVKNAYYLFYPLHISIIYLVIYLTTLIGG